MRITQGWTLQCKNSRNGTAVPCDTSSLPAVGTCRSCCGPRDGARPPSRARPPHGRSQGSPPCLMPCALGGSSRGWILPHRLPGSQPAPPQRPASLPRRDAVCDVRPVLLTCRPPAISTAWRGTAMESYAAIGAGGEGVRGVHVSFMACPCPWAAPAQPQAQVKVALQVLCPLHRNSSGTREQSGEGWRCLLH